MKNETATEELKEMSYKPLDDLRMKIKNVFEEIGSTKSSGWKERLIFDMLESVKIHDESKFLWLLLKTLNSYREEQNVNELLNTMSKIHIEDMPEKTFEKVAYTIIMGIMSSRDKGGE